MGLLLAVSWLFSRGAFCAWLEVAISLLCCTHFDADLDDTSGVMEVRRGDLKAA